MAKKKRRRGVRTYAPHSFVTIIYPFFALLIVGVFVSFVFLPMFTYAPQGEVALTFTGFDFIKLCLKKFLPFLGMPIHETFEAYFSSAAPENELLKLIIKFRDFIQLGLAGLFALTLAFAIAELITALLWFITGKSEHPTLLDDFSRLTAGFFLFTIGMSYMYFFFYYWIIESTGNIVNINLSLILLALMGVMAFSAIMIYLLFRFYFQDRIALEKKEKAEGAKKSAIVDTFEGNAGYVPPQEDGSIPANNQEPLPIYNEGKVAHNQAPIQQALKGTSAVIKVGNMAYAKNKEIVEAVIPEGIKGLGSAAFADCRDLTSVTIPSSVIDIGFNCFMNTPKLTSITYNGTIERWKNVARGSNWLHKSGTKTVRCLDGQINVDTRH